MGAGIDLGHIVLVGAGNMGGAMLCRWPADARVTVIDPKPSDEIALHMREAGREYRATPDGADPADLMVVAVKPQLMSTVLPTLRPLVSERTTVMSIAAGTTIATFSAALGTDCVVRTIPNTPAMVGEGMTGAFAAPGLDAEAKRRAEALLMCSGAVVWVASEADIDRVTAVSGSGPAYLFHMVESLGDAAVALGLPEADARTLARQTVIGAAALLAASDESASTLRERVTSPGGTTAAALDVLMGEDRLRSLMVDAVRAAHARAVELGTGE